MKILFWNTDTQKDFIDTDGKLAVEGAKDIRPNLKLLTEIAKKHDIQVVNTQDYHSGNDTEISETPDFISTFPAHCIEGTDGAEFINETKPENTYLIHNDENKEINRDEVIEARNIVIRKNQFDVFTGNKFTRELVNLIKPEIVVVYGVATNVCVNCAVIGLAVKGIKVVVPMDAIKELPDLSLKELYVIWNDLPVFRTSTKTVKFLVELLGDTDDN